jgi:hypothetical protein
MIRVLHNYGGANTRERRIEPGDYAEDDPRLFGLADYLLQNDHAIVIGEGARPYTPPNEDAPVFLTRVSVDERGNPVAGDRRPVTAKDLHPELSVKDGDRDQEDASQEDPIHRLVRADASARLRSLAQLDAARDILDGQTIDASLLDGLPLTDSEQDLLDAKIDPAYDAMTVTELRALAKERGLAAPSSLTKAELVALLKGEV